MSSHWDSFPSFYLCSLQDVKDFMQGAGNSDWDDNLLMPFIYQASYDFAAELQRLPLPYVETFQADYAKGYVDDSSRYLILYPHIDLLSLSSLSNGDGQTINSGYYTVDNANEYPKSTITIKLNAPIRFRPALDGNYQQVISLSGIFGYVPHYNHAWRNKTTITEALDSSSSNIKVASSGGLSIGDYLKIDNEVLNIISISGVDVVVDRAVLGTTGVAHLDNAAVMLFIQKSDIRNAVREWASYLWKTKDKIGEDILVYEGFTRVPRGLSPLVVNAILRNRKLALDGLNGRFN